MTLEELNAKYGHENVTVDELKERKKQTGSILDPIYLKHLPAGWIIQEIWGLAANETISLQKARELTSAVIEEHFNKLLVPPELALFFKKINDIIDSVYTSENIYYIIPIEDNETSRNRIFEFFHDNCFTDIKFQVVPIKFKEKIAGLQKIL